MADQKLTLKILGDNASVKKTFKELKGETSGFSKGMAAVGGTMLAAGVAIDKGLGVATDAAKDYGSQVILIQRMTGDAAKESSEWAAILGRYGITGKKAALTIKSLNNAIVEHSDGLAKLGIATQNSDGSNRKSMEVFADLAEKYKTSKDKSEVLAVATKTLGRGFADLLPVLASGKKGIEELTAAAEANGLILSEKDLVAVKGYNKALKDNEEALKGVKVQVGLATLPYETFKTKALGDTLKILRDLNPELAKNAGAMGGVVADLSKLGGVSLLGLAALPQLAKGLEMIGGTSTLASAGIGAAGLTLTGLVATISHLNANKAQKDFEGFAKSLGLNEQAASAYGRTLGALSGGPVGVFTEALYQSKRAVDAVSDRMGIHRKASQSQAQMSEYQARVAKETADKFTAEAAAMAAATTETQRLKDAQATLTQAHLAVRDSEITAIQSKLDYKQAQKDVTAAEKQYGKGSDEYKLAVLLRKKAHDDAKTATKAHKDEIAKEQQAEKEATKSKAYLDYIAAMETAWSDATVKARQYRAVVSSITSGGKQASGDNQIPWTIPGKKPPKKAAGGVFRRSQVVEIGEASPSKGEWAINADRAARGDTRQLGLIAGLLATVGMSAGGDTYNVEVNGDGSPSQVRMYLREAIARTRPNGVYMQGVDTR